MTINLLDLNPDQLKRFYADIGEPAFRAKQLIQWVHQQGITDFSLMHTLGKACIEKLNSRAAIELPTVLVDKTASDGTRKWLLEMRSGNAIEMVFIPEKTRGTLCVSSQIGCALNCSFCSTGKQGFNRNLSLGEIIAQVFIAHHALQKSHPERHKVLTNVVMMGMGEPLLNFEPVVDAMDLMMSDIGYGLSKYRVTLSTSGVVPQIEALKERSPCALAISLHAPNDAIRNTLVPLNKKYPMALLLKTCREYFPAGSKREILIEYVMLAGMNDQIAHAKELVRQLKSLPCKVNLIPFNPFPKTEYKTSSLDVIRAFQKVLTEKGIKTFIRKTRGDDIDAACGQLAGEFKDRTGRHKRWQETGRLVPKKKS